MDMNILKYMAFIKPVECGSFTKAADVLNYSQCRIELAREQAPQMQKNAFPLPGGNAFLLVLRGAARQRMRGGLFV